VRQAVPGNLDSLATDSAAADTSSVVADLSRNLEETGRLIREGRFEELYARASAMTLDFIVEGLIPALLVLGLFWALYRLGHGVLAGVLRRSRRMDEGVRQLLLKTFRLVMYAFAGIMVLDQLGVNVAALVAGLGIVGIALGFAARDTLENFISGITILLDQPFRVGDNIEVADTFGAVQEITLRSTRIRTLNHQIAVLPNSQMITQRVINHTLLDTLRVVVPFGIAYKERPAEAREVVLRATDGDDRLHPDRAPEVVVTALSDSSVDMELRLFLRDPKLEVPVRFEYIERVREALREADIEIPFPHLQMFLDEAKALEGRVLFSPEGGPPGAPRAEA
jgi:small conductance mechanosensitive channel